MIPKINWRVVSVIGRRDLKLYFSSPTGYVFLTLFIFLSAAAAFWQQRFFADNLANLDTLNSVFPFILLFFVPALTMSIWADERRRGTEELLLTLPATDVEVVMGKYFAAVGIFTVSLIVSLSHVAVLLWLGRPDMGLMFGNYVGFWLLGAAMVAIGMVASLLTAHATIGFILGALFCSFFVFVTSTQFVVSEWLQRILAPLGVFEHFSEYSRGLMTLGGLVYFLSVIGFMLYLNVLLLGRRHWPAQVEGQRFGLHQAARAVAVAVALVSLNVIVARAGIDLDVTAEGLHSISPETKELIRSLPKDKQVFIQAYVSPEVPRDYVETRNNLINSLNEIASLAPDRVQVLIHDTEPFTDAAKDARDKFGIVSRDIVSMESARTSTVPVFMGLAFTCGASEEVIPFFDRGLPAEYELVRSIRVVTKAERKNIGVVTTAAKVFGGFDFESMQSTPPWGIVQELQKQYNVTQIDAAQPISETLDGLLVILPSSLPQNALDNLRDYVMAGHPTLIIDDPLPLINPALSPVLPSDAQSNPFTRNQSQQPEPKGNVQALISQLGIHWDPQQIIWDTYNPHPELGQVPPEILFLGKGDVATPGFNPDHPASSGLQEVVALYSGCLIKAQDSPYEFTPLLRTGHLSGALAWQQLVQRSFFGMGLNRNPRRQPTGESYIVAAEVKGTGPLPTGATGEVKQPKVNAIVITDLDLISEQFFQFRERGLANYNFDNVTFVLNCMDHLVGDESFVGLRKKRIRHRTLESVEAQTQQFVEKRLEDEKKAEEEAQTALSDAQKRLNDKVSEISNRTDLDMQTKQIMAQNMQEVENRRFEVTKANIESRKQATVQRSKEEMESNVRRIQSRIRALAVLLPPIPVLVVGVFVFLRRRKREREGAAAARRMRS